MGWSRWPLTLMLLGLAAGLGYAVLSLPEQAAGLQRIVADQMDRSGVTNPVTAVLLNFRGYDTFLEMVVLLVALLGIGTQRELPPADGEDAPGLVLDMLTRILVPVLVLTAAYLLWAGAHQPGGAFQAGAVLGAAGVLLLLSGWHLPYPLVQLPLRTGLVAGVAAFLAVAVLTLAGGGQMLEYPPGQSGMLILVIEAFATVSIGVTLTALFVASGARAEGEH